MTEYQQWHSIKLIMVVIGLSVTIALVVGYIATVIAVCRNKDPAPRLPLYPWPIPPPIAPLFREEEQARKIRAAARLPKGQRRGKRRMYVEWK